MVISFRWRPDTPARPFIRLYERGCAVSTRRFKILLTPPWGAGIGSPADRPLRLHQGRVEGGSSSPASRPPGSIGGRLQRPASVEALTCTDSVVLTCHKTNRFAV